MVGNYTLLCSAAKKLDGVKTAVPFGRIIIDMPVLITPEQANCHHCFCAYTTGSEVCCYSCFLTEREYIRLKEINETYAGEIGQMCSKVARRSQV